ncbi:hypothetical protein DAPPUDRAFT_120812, partial [Daphnia pulex]
MEAVFPDITPLDMGRTVSMDEPLVDRGEHIAGQASLSLYIVKNKIARRRKVRKVASDTEVDVVGICMDAMLDSLVQKVIAAGRVLENAENTFVDSFRGIAGLPVDRGMQYTPLSFLFALVALKTYVPTHFTTFHPPSEIRIVAQGAVASIPTVRPMVHINADVTCAPFTSTYIMDGTTYRLMLSTAMVVSLVHWLKDNGPHTPTLFLVPVAEEHTDSAHFGVAFFDKRRRVVDVFNIEIGAAIVDFCSHVKVVDSVAHEVLADWDTHYHHINQVDGPTLQNSDVACVSWAALYTFMRVACVEEDLLAPRQLTDSFNRAIEAGGELYPQAYAFGRYLADHGEQLVYAHGAAPQLVSSGYTRMLYKTMASDTSYQLRAYYLAAQ